MIRTLQGLRGIFVTLIFLVHYPLDGPPTFVPGGDCGVAFFMMLSGFVMSAGYEKRLLATPVAPVKFAMRRMAKVYPLHLLFFVLAVTLYDYVFDGATIAKAIINLALLQSWVPSDTYTFNPVSWFLSVVMFFYLIFPLLVRFRLPDRRAAVGAFFVVTAIYVALIWLIPDDTAEYVCYNFPPARLIDFTGGMLLWRLYSSLRRQGINERFGRLSMAARSAVELAAVTLLVATIYVYEFVPVCYKVAALWWPSMVTIILVFSLSDNHSGLIGSLLKNRLLQAFGAASFVFFLFHRLGMSVIFRILERTGIELTPTPLLIVNFLGVTAGALLIYYFIQSRWVKILNRDRA